MTLIDTSTEFGQRVERRLAEEPVVWLTTVHPNGTPQPSPVWFVREGDDALLIYSQPNTPKLRNIEAHPKVAVSLNATFTGGDVVIFTGDARVDTEAPPVSDNVPYITKYRYGGQDTLGSTGLMPDEFSAEYSVPVRVELAKLRGF